MRFPMSLLVLSAGFFNTIVSGSSNVIPTREEQANLLTNVEEVFEQVKVLVNVEGNSTDEFVADDIKRMIERAKNTLTLVEELTLTKISTNANSVCMLDSKPIIHDLVQKGCDELEDCLEKGSADIVFNSRQLTNVTDSATESGQDFLNKLHNCSRKLGLGVISCYKDVIAKDVLPVKNMLLGAIEAHKEAHLRTIKIRNEANDCVDDILEKYQNKIAEVLSAALVCK